MRRPHILRIKEYGLGHGYFSGSNHKPQGIALYKDIKIGYLDYTIKGKLGNIINYLIDNPNYTISLTSNDAYNDNPYIDIVLSRDSGGPIGAAKDAITNIFGGFIGASPVIGKTAFAAGQAINAGSTLPGVYSGLDATSFRTLIDGENVIQVYPQGDTRGHVTRQNQLPLPKRVQYPYLTEELILEFCIRIKPGSNVKAIQVWDDSITFAQAVTYLC
ncbi:MAG: hypothetical protein K2Q30_09355 [Gemmataceae bacterium]|nr:hypothetical protein [Gemmataceae bacterium]